MRKPVSFDASPDDATLIEKIVDRAKANWPKIDRLEITMDLTACHANGNPLRLADLLAANDFDFIHDVYGIRVHLNRRTGRLGDHFTPRYSQN